MTNSVTPIQPTVPAWMPAGGTPADAKEERRRRKQAAKLLRDSERPPNSWERFRILIEVVDQQRSIAEIADHKARYALVILGVLNAVIFVLLGRGDVFREMPEPLKPWLIGLVVLYSALTFLFVLHAIDCLRPRELSGQATLHRAGIPGLLFWEGIVQHDPAEYRREWVQARMADLTADATVAAYLASRLVQAKYRALHRLYAGLVVLVGLCTALLAAYAIWGTVP